MKIRPASEHMIQARARGVDGARLMFWLSDEYRSIRDQPTTKPTTKPVIKPATKRATRALRSKLGWFVHLDR